MKVYIVEQPCTMLTSQRVVGVYSNKELAKEAADKINSEALSVLSTVKVSTMRVNDPCVADKFIQEEKNSYGRKGNN